MRSGKISSGFSEQQRHQPPAAAESHTSATISFCKRDSVTISGCKKHPGNPVVRLSHAVHDGEGSIRRLRIGGVRFPYSGLGAFAVCGGQPRYRPSLHPFGSVRRLPCPGWSWTLIGEECRRGVSPATAKRRFLLGTVHNALLLGPVPSPPRIYPLCFVRHSLYLRFGAGMLCVSTRLTRSRSPAHPLPSMLPYQRHLGGNGKMEEELGISPSGQD